MKCVHCGANIPDGQLICPRCNAEVQMVPDYNPLDDVLAREVKGSVEGATRQIRTDDVRRQRQMSQTQSVRSTRVLNENQMERLREALATLTPRRASCLHARFWEGKQFKEIAEAEGFTTSAAIVTVRNAIIKLQKYYIKRGWMKPPKEKTICTKTAPPKRNRKKTSAKKS